MPDLSRTLCMSATTVFSILGLAYTCGQDNVDYCSHNMQGASPGSETRGIPETVDFSERPGRALGHLAGGSSCCRCPVPRSESGSDRCRHHQGWWVSLAAQGHNPAVPGQNVTLHVISQVLQPRLVVSESSITLEQPCQVCMIDGVGTAWRYSCSVQCVMQMSP